MNKRTNTRFFVLGSGGAATVIQRPGRVVFSRPAVLAAVTCAALVSSCLMFTPPPASADDDVAGGTTTEEVTAALDQVDGDLVRTPVPSKPAERSATGLAIEVPEVASHQVTMSAGDFLMGISLPNASDAGRGETQADGSTVYPSTGASANAVVPTEGGPQLLSVITSEDAPEEYPYELSLPAAHRLESTPDGGAHVVDEEGRAKVLFEPAWAQDAAGRSVPTRYEVEGNTLTQIVYHHGVEGIAYPVVADPLPVIVIVITAAALIVVAAAALGVAAWLVSNWWNQCRAQGMYPELSNRNGFTARCVR